MAIYVDNCPRCASQNITFDVHGANHFGNYKEFPKPEVPAYEFFCVCRECHKTTIFLGISIDKHQELHRISWGVAMFGLKDVAKILRPISPADLSVGEPPDFLPQEINDAYEEGAKCLAIGCNNAAGTMFRLCLDYATKGLVPDGDGGPACCGQLKLATALEFFQYRFSDSFGGNPPLYSCGLSAL
ncbi:hypothetical protein ABNT06_05795 [Kosakonia sacchari]|uniref:hypothetical protein n=1 Tax=Kosakonia sacchari TaxID=1158459 RepID=UPI0032D9A35B